MKARTIECRACGRTVRADISVWCGFCGAVLPEPPDAREDRQ